MSLRSRPWLLILAVGGYLTAGASYAAQGVLGWSVSHEVALAGALTAIAAFIPSLMGGRRRGSGKGAGS